MDYLDGSRIRFVRSSANPLFDTASTAYGRGVVAVVLTGHDGDATDGVQALKAGGGIVIAQSPETCKVPDMPRSAIKTGAVDIVRPLQQIAAALVRIVNSPAVMLTI